MDPCIHNVLVLLTLLKCIAIWSYAYVAFFKDIMLFTQSLKFHSNCGYTRSYIHANWICLSVMNSTHLYTGCVSGLQTRETLSMGIF